MSEEQQQTVPKMMHVLEALSHSRLILVLCRGMELERLKRDFEQWHDERFRLVAYGMTPKRFDGFLLFEVLEQPVTRAFMDKLMGDYAIFDYIPINLLTTGA
jgi:hypothetical protein